MARLGRLPEESSRPPLAQWLGVTLLLALAFLALLQVIGPELRALVEQLLKAVRGIVS
jgi:hypothetical protein